MLKKTLKKIVEKTRENKAVVIKRPCVRCFRHHTANTAFCGRVCRWLWLRRKPVSVKS